MQFVPIKNVQQQDLQALHRVRERLMGARTALVNEIRGLLAEYGIVLPAGVNAFRNALAEKLEAEQAKLTPLSQEVFGKLWAEFEKLQALATTPLESQRLLAIPGIGPISATALIAAVGDVGGFTNGRQFAAWLGLGIQK
jgi:transposase